MPKTKPELPVITVYGNAVNDDTDALNKILNGEARGVYPDGRPFPQAGEHKTTRTIEIK